MLLGFILKQIQQLLIRMKKISHIINPGIFSETSDLYLAQPITFETMRIARDFAAGRVEVKLLSAQYPEDRPVVPDFFKATPDLERSILDIGEFNIRRKLPLLKDILDRAYQAAASDYIIYTNVDIGLMPNFYLSVDKLIDSGFDAFAINRRSISKAHARLDEIPLMYAEIGSPHMGYDCFIFKREAYSSFELGNICIGAAHIGKVVITNQIIHSKQFQVFQNHHLTFHIGNEKAWRSHALSDYEAHNRKEYEKIMAGLNSRQQAIVKSTLSGYRKRGLKNKIGMLLGFDQGI